MKGNQFARGSMANRTSFRFGHKPWNKDKKGIHLSPNTEFKKGQKGDGWLAVGTITIRIDKSKSQRQWIKVGEPSQWTEYAKFIWTQKNGVIPKGFIIHHIDKNTLNDNINNLAMVTRKEHFEIHEVGKLGRKKIADLAEDRLRQEELFK